MISGIIFLMCISVIIAVIGISLYKRFKPVFTEEYKYYIGLSKREKIVFDSLEKVGIPVVKMTVEGKRYHFILDSGADYSLINSKFIPSLNQEKLIYGGKQDTTTVSGDSMESLEVTIPISYRNQVFNEKFLSTNLSSVFKMVGDRAGIEIVGLLGSNFFKEHRWTLDFDKMVVWLGK